MNIHCQHRALFATGCLLLACAVTGAHAGGLQELQQITITGSTVNQIGVADSASVGTVTQEQLAARTVYRPGELLEATPGLVVSQHSGEGKANQFYLRGFNLDHGTDLRTSVDGMLVNQRSHAHGQGWTDLNFIIPELATGLRYKKGPYFASEGDFASAGAVELTYADSLPAGLASVSLGENGYRRAVLADSTAVNLLGAGRLLFAVEALHNDGPFVHPDDFSKFNGVLRYAQGDRANGFNLTAMGYGGRWNATDQIPLRAVQAGELDRFDAIDPTDGGRARRYSLSGNWRRSNATSSTELSAAVVRSRLDLYSNFTYFLDDPVHGDQFAQPDRRTTTLVNLRHAWPMTLLGRDSENQIGLQLQNDNIFNGLVSTQARQTLSTTRRDHIVETSGGLWFDNATRWSEIVRTVVGVRIDNYRFDVDSDNPDNSGRRSATIANPKASLILGPFFESVMKTEFYLNAGGGFHSNDARGTVIHTDPKSGEAVDPVTPLVRSRGYELGVRTVPLKGLQTALSLYQLDFDSELVFVGDAGTTEAGRPSRRIGFELSNYYQASDWLTVDADLAFAEARFRDAAPEGRRIAGAVEGVASVALALDNLGPWFGALQYRYFGPRPLIEDNSVRSGSTATVNGRIGYKINPRIKIELEGFNLLDRKASAIDYDYASRLQREPAEGIDDIHFHPIESRSFRLTLNANF